MVQVVPMPTVMVRLPVAVAADESVCSATEANAAINANFKRRYMDPPNGCLACVAPGTLPAQQVDGPSRQVAQRKLDFLGCRAGSLHGPRHVVEHRAAIADGQRLGRHSGALQEAAFCGPWPRRFIGN